MSLLSLKEVHSKKVGDILLLAKTRTETVQIVSVCNADREVFLEAVRQFYKNLAENLAKALKLLARSVFLLNAN